VKTFSAVVAAAAQQLRSQTPFAWLYEAEMPTTPPTRFRLTNYNETITYGTSSTGSPLTYSPFPIAHGGIEQTSEGDLPTIQVDIGNASREVATRVETHGGLIGQPVDIKLVYIGDLSNPAPVLEETVQIVGCTMTADVVTFTLSAYNLYKQQFPARRYIARHCPFQFGGPECGYKIALGNFPTCTFTLAACDERGDDEVATGQARQHPERWGGFAGIPRLTSV
jgi:lambda family phage minor tail protein L